MEDVIHLSWYAIAETRRILVSGEKQHTRTNTLVPAPYHQLYQLV